MLSECSGSQTDLWVLTARDKRQARLFETQLRELSARKVLPEGVRWTVVADPGGSPLGTGGATLHAICTAIDALRTAQPELRGVPAENILSRRRVFVVHCGGLSQRLPQFAQLGKVFAPVPDPRCFPTPLLAQVVRSLVAVAQDVSGGVFVACGDALFLCDPSEVRLAGVDAAVLVYPASPVQASAHGVYGRDPVTGLATRILQKATPAEMLREGIVNVDGTVLMDTGLIYFSPAVSSAWLGMLASGDRPEAFRTRFLRDRGNWHGVEFYRDVMGAMVPEASAGPLRRAFRAYQLSVLAPASGQFIHFGTTRELIQVLCQPRFTEFGGVLQSQVVPDVDVSPDSLIHASVLEGACSYVGSHSVVHFSEARGRLALAGNNYVHGLRTSGDVALPAGCALYQPPVRQSAGGGDALVLFGVGDNPKLSGGQGGTYLGSPLEEWVEQHRLSSREVWPGIDEAHRTLWNAQLFPRGTHDAIYAALPWMLDAGSPTASRNAWHALPRCSMEEVALSFDISSWRRHEQHVIARIIAAQIQARLELGEPSEDLLEAVRLLRIGPRVASALQSSAIRSRRPSLAAALWQHCAVVVRKAELPDSPVVDSPPAAARAQQRAFSSVGSAVYAGAQRTPAAQGRSLPVGAALEMRAPVRIDLAGGWSDTPPQSLDLGGSVLNVALDLDGARPIGVRIERIEAPQFELAAEDQECQVTISGLDELRRCGDPSDPVALHKAALMEAGIIPASARDLRQFLQGKGGGLRVTTESCVPKGSGLGTSSILGAALVAAVQSAWSGSAEAPEQLCARVLRLEQRLSTGGGWQDQIGALYGGIKVATTHPGADQIPTVEALAVTTSVVEQFESRLVLCYTGVPRLARNVLQRVVARYLLREPGVLSALQEMQELVQQLRIAFLDGDLDTVGQVVSRSWELNKLIEPSATNPELERLFEAVAPLSAGAKLAGAGGGGFMLVIARDAESVPEVRRRLALAGSPTPTFYRATVSHRGLATFTIS